MFLWRASSGIPETIGHVLSSLMWWVPESLESLSPTLWSIYLTKASKVLEWINILQKVQPIQILSDYIMTECKRINITLKLDHPSHMNANWYSSSFLMEKNALTRSIVAYLIPRLQGLTLIKSTSNRASVTEATFWLCLQ